MIFKNKNLKILLMGWNQIGGKGAWYIASALKVNIYLFVLDCWFNAFGQSK